MTKKEDLHVVKPTTSVDEALETLVEQRITGFPVIDDNWNLVGVVSDYDLLALDSISGPAQNDNSMFPEVDRTWKTFNEVQKLLSKTNGKVIGELMSTAPMVVQETTNLEDAARLLLETKYRRLPVVDAQGTLVGIITRGNVVRAALQIKHATENESMIGLRRSFKVFSPKRQNKSCLMLCIFIREMLWGSLAAQLQVAFLRRWKRVNQILNFARIRDVSRS